MADPKITVLEQIDQLEEIVLEGSRIPFSGGRLVNEQDAVEVMDALREAIPPQMAQAVELIRQREEFIAQARNQADEIVNQGRQQREQLINSASIRQEAERHVAEMREQTRQQCEQLLLQARQQVAQSEQEFQARQAQQEQQFAARRQQLEQEAAERNRLLLEQHERNRQQAMAELEQIRQEGLRIQRDSQAEAERLQNDALQFRQQTQHQCDALVARSRQEASTIQDGANHYAEQVLSELEGRLQELSKVVLGGRHELGRLMASQITAADRAVQSGPRHAAAERESGKSTTRRLASRLRRVTEGLS
jgi:F0F1-type ATP synthase membrane subunit b/b'